MRQASFLAPLLSRWLGSAAKRLPTCLDPWAESLMAVGAFGMPPACMRVVVSWMSNQVSAGRTAAA
jgi:hypothetical protein